MANKNVQQAPGAGYRNILVINMFRWRKKGLRSRARFKLEEIQQGDNIFRPGMTIVDLGAAPGGWSQYAVNHIGQSGALLPVTCYRWIPSSAWISFRAISVTKTC